MSDVENIHIPVSHPLYFTHTEPSSVKPITKNNSEVVDDEIEDQGEVEATGFLYAYQQPTQVIPINHLGQSYSGTFFTAPGQFSTLQFTPVSQAHLNSDNNVHTTVRRRSRNIQEQGPPFNVTKQLETVYSLDGSSPFSFKLHPKLDKGFFSHENDWTCYRRNYFQLSCFFTAIDTEGQKLQIPCIVENAEGRWQVNQFLIGVTARTSNSNREIELIQHTAKRDKGPQESPKPRACDPQFSGSSFQPDAEARCTAIFERLQFKCATANNGRRRAAQQYHILVVDLFARTGANILVKVATTESAPLVARGRAPGHYAAVASKASGSSGELRFDSVEGLYATDAPGSPDGRSFSVITGGLAVAAPAAAAAGGQVMYSQPYDMQYFQQFQQFQQFQIHNYAHATGWTYAPVSNESPQNHSEDSQSEDNLRKTVETQESEPEKILELPDENNNEPNDQLENRDTRSK